MILSKIWLLNRVFVFSHYYAKYLQNKKYRIGINPLSAKLTKWPNTLKQFHLVGLALKGLHLLSKNTINVVRLLDRLLNENYSSRDKYGQNINYWPFHFHRYTTRLSLLPPIFATTICLRQCCHVVLLTKLASSYWPLNIIILMKTVPIL